LALGGGALSASGVTRIDDAEAVAVSYPAFWTHLDELTTRGA
jgi:5-enolpyruvylshikimate-3-phosphate synthase